MTAKAECGYKGSMTKLTNRIALYPGTFDPLTNGHLDIIRRACKLCDKLVIGVAINSGKNPLFTLTERTEMVKEALNDIKGDCEVEVVSFEGLLIHFVETIGASMIVRGLRAVSDFEFEYQMVGMNHKLNPEIETVFLMADAQHQAIASRLVKEIAQLGGEVSHFVSPSVKQKLEDKFS
jgi:pantetheine-phosphate adenylyltransferase